MSITEQPTEIDAAARFRADTPDHEMTILHDDGLYRHLRFRAPEPKSSMFWFDLITWPGCLTIRGDLGDSYTFQRLTDMFEFFRSPSGWINAHYWSEKLDRHRGSAKVYSEGVLAKVYSEGVFRQLVVEHFVETVQSGRAPRGLGKAIRAEVLDQDLSDEAEARRILEDFEFGDRFELLCRCGEKASFGTSLDVRLWGTKHLQQGRGPCAFVGDIKEVPGFRFHDVWEWSFQDFEWQFLWACHAIVWGIGQYDAAKAKRAATAARMARPGVRNLVQILNAHSGRDGSCWIVPSPGRWAFLAPREGGSLYSLQGFQRRTIDEAVSLGLVRLGGSAKVTPELQRVPNWLLRTVPQPLEGHTITLVGGAS